MYTAVGACDLSWVHDHIYAAGGSYIPAHWWRFRDQTGIRCVLHIRPERPAPFEGPAPSAYLWLDLDDERQAATSDRWLAAAFIGGALRRGEDVLLHASLGRHRTRWAFVAYLIWSGTTLRGALRQAEEKPWMSPYHTRDREWEDYEAAVRRGRGAARTGHEVP
jgi:hypothetical protein